MRNNGYLILSVILGSLVLMGALPWAKTPRKPALAQISIISKTDPEATARLEKALQAMATPRLTVVETVVWQQLHLSNLEVETEGRYLQGPGQRYRLELKTRAGNHVGNLLQVSDGDFLWQGTNYDAKTAENSWEDVQRLPLEHTSGSPISLHPGERPYGERAVAFTGVQPLLKNLRNNLVWTQKENLKLGDKDCIVVTGTWTAPMAAALAPADKPWPDGLPQVCRLWLDSKNSWPHRIEWIGPARDGKEMPVIVEMELRNPVFNQSLTDTQMAREFSFDPGNCKVRENADPDRRRPLVTIGFNP